MIAGKHSPLEAVSVAIFIAAFFAQGVWVAANNGLTNDEALHIPAAVSYYAARDFRMNTEHPTLTKWIIGAALAAMNLNVPIGGAAWEAKDQVAFADEFWRTNSDRQRAILLWARLPLLLLVSLSGLLVFALAKLIYGKPAAFAALALFSFEPNLIAHASLANSDAAIAAAAAACVYFALKFVKTGRSADFVLLLIFTALACVTKFSGLFIPLATMLIFAWSYARSNGEYRPPEKLLGVRIPGRESGARVLGLLILYAAFVAAALAIAIPASYSLRLTRITPENSPMFEERLDSALGGGGALRGAAETILKSIPVPKEYILGVYQIRQHSKMGHPAYLFGEFSPHGWWYYFPVIFFFKTPIALLLLLAISAALTGLKSRSVRLDETAILIPVFLYVLAAMSSGMNFGIRHILFIYPLLLAYSAGAAFLSLRLGGLELKPFALNSLLILFVTASSFAQMPYPLSYMNEFAGGPQRRAYIMSDSNLDWGQGLPALKKWADSNGAENIKLFYGNLRDNHEVYGLDAVMLDSRDAVPDGFQPGNVYAVSLWVATGYSEITDMSMFGDQKEKAIAIWRRFKDAPPDAVAGGCIWIYDLR